jgi:large subunit ribosomal protein L17
MRHNKTTIKLGRSQAHRKALLNNLAAQLFLYESIKTTEAKAKALRQYAEPMITKAKEGKLHQRRDILGKLPMKTAVKKLFDVIGPRYKDRDGGYLRIIKLKTRIGDGAKIVKIELV